VVTRSYNGFGEMESETQYGGRTFTFTHDATGAVTKVTFPSGGPVMEVEYVYDAVGRVQEVKRNLSADVEGVGTPALTTGATFGYAGHREVERVQAPYDLTRTQTWTAWREPSVLKYEVTSTGALLTGLQSWWDDDGRMVVRERLHDADGTQWGEVFRYDEMGRLVTMWRNVANPSAYTSVDPVDGQDTFDDKVEYVLGPVYERDRVKVTPNGGTTTTTEYTDNAFYQYTDVGGTAWTWDGNGQLTDKGDWAFEWTVLGQLAKATPDTGTAREYLYDAFGRRVETKAGSAVSQYVYVGWHMVGEHDGTAWLWQEVPLPGEGMLEQVALDTNDIDGDQDTSEYRGYAVHEDFQDTVWGLSDTSGGMVERYRYREPYGDNYGEDGQGNGVGEFASAVYQVKRLHGGVVDQSTELYDYRNRWMEAATGSWSVRDPFGSVESSNLYQYVLVNPLSNADVFGLWTNVHNRTDQRITVCNHLGGFRGDCRQVPPHSVFESPRIQWVDFVVVCCPRGCGTFRANFWQRAGFKDVTCQCDREGNPTCSGATRMLECSGNLKGYGGTWDRKSICLVCRNDFCRDEDLCKMCCPIACFWLYIHPVRY